MSYQPWLAIYNSFLAKTEVHRTLYWMFSDMPSTRRRTIPPTGSAPSSGKVSEPGSPPLSNNSPPLLRNTHDPPSTEIAVHVAKQTLKRKAAEGDMPTKYLCSEAVSGMGFEARAKLRCQLSPLSRMARRSRQVANRHPSNPISLEDLHIPADYILSHSNESICGGLISHIRS